MFFPCVVVCPVGFDAGDGASAGAVELAVDELAALRAGGVDSLPRGQPIVNDAFASSAHADSW